MHSTVSPVSERINGIEDSIFVKRKILCVVLATVFMCLGITFSGLSLGLGLEYDHSYNCDNCCEDDFHCMQNLGFVCRNGLCECNKETNHISFQSNTKNMVNTSSLTLCGSYNWTCSNSSDCRSNIGLNCYFQRNSRQSGICNCSIGFYYDVSENRCLNVKGYLQPCSGQSNECDISKDLVCNTASSYYACNCPATSIVNTCDCDMFYFYNISSNKCEPVKDYMEDCTGAYFDECDSSLGLVCNTNGTQCNCPSTSSIYTCDCATGYYYNGAQCVPYDDYTDPCSLITVGYASIDTCDRNKNLYCNLPNNFNLCDCPAKSTTYTCECILGYFYSNGTCVPQFPANDFCTVNYECQSTYCISGVCF